MDMERKAILDYLINSLLLERLELADDGFTAADFNEDTELLGPNGPELDSLDALDLLIGIERKYQLEAIEINGDFIEQHCGTLASVIDMVQARIRQAALAAPV